MEDGAHLAFKVPPPNIDFTLPSPPIGIPQASSLDPPWMPHIKSRVQELTLNEEDTTSQTIMTMTKTRRKQKQEILQRAIRQAEERRMQERQQYQLCAVAVPQQSAYEPALFQTPAVAEDHDDEEGAGKPAQVVPVSQPLFPPCLCAIVPAIVETLDDVAVNPDGLQGM